MCRGAIYLIWLVLLLILPGGTIQADTIAYWRFDDVGDADIEQWGPVAAGNPLPDSDGESVWRKAAHDWSGNGNHLTTWELGWAGFNWSDDVPAAQVPLTGAENQLSMVHTQAMGCCPSSMTWSEQSLPSGANIETMTPAAFTIEASFKAESLTSYHTIVGRDDQYVATANGDLASLYFQVTPSREVAIKFTDSDGYFHEAISAADAVTTGQWYNMAAVSDGSTMSLYLDNVLVAEVDLTGSGSTDTSMALGSSSGADWESGTWTVGRGMYAGGHTDRWFGHVDEVRISDTALAPSQFLFPATGARNPVPPNDSPYSEAEVLLQWQAGCFAASHDVYVGDNFADVNNATTSTPGIYKGRQSEDYYPTTGLMPLELGKDYYWRIDEVNDLHPAKVWRGQVWKFTVQSLTAYDPNPPDEARYVDRNVNLAWSAGFRAQRHNVYFGTDPDNLPLLSGMQGATTYNLDTLNYGTTYYWRIDEYDATNMHTGDVWSFTTLPNIPIADPNLVGWWKFDEGQGSIAVDWSGHGHHGALQGGPQWEAGYDGGALRLDGTDDYVNLPIGPTIASLGSTTITTWVDFSNTGGAWQRIFDFGSSTTQGYMFLCPRSGTDGPIRFAITATGNAAGEESIVDTDNTLPSGWHHVGVVINATTSRVEVYVDGAVAASGITATLPSDLGQTSNNWLGRSQYAADAYFNGALDDFRIYDYAMSETEIADTMRGDPSLAWNPKPANGSTIDVEKAGVLTWSPGEKAVEHDVYFGADRTAVENADASDTTGIYRGRQGSTTYSLSETLQWGRTYYWRIDEYNTDTTISTGWVWSFTIAEYLTVDDFEDYNDYTPDRIWQTWRDGFGFSDPPPGYGGNGTGSQVGNDSTPFTEQTTVHGDQQAMTFRYTNNGSTGKTLYSEAQREWAVPQDWTRKGVKALTLWFYGDAANSAEPLYVGLQDSLGVRKDVPHENPNAALVGRWQEWNIDLEEFANAGVNLASIKTVYIGVGNRTSPRMGGTGRLYFDDIRLYRPRCTASLLKPDADLDENCVVDYDDILILGERWLDTGLMVVPASPGSAGLVGHWKLDDGFGATAADSSGNASNGTVSGDPQWVAGHDGGALWFDGTNDYVELPIGWLISSLTNSTFATWVDFSNAGGGWQRIFDFGNDTTSYMFLTPRMGVDGAMRFGITVEGGGAPEQPVTGPSTLAGGWHHVAVTINADQDTITLYQDGSVAAQNTEATLSPSDLGVTAYNWLGRSQYEADAYYMGLIDDFRIYSRALTQAEVAWLAGRTSAFSVEQDLDRNGTIDFKDYAILADQWLAELLWPQP